MNEIDTYVDAIEDSFFETVEYSRDDLRRYLSRPDMTASIDGDDGFISLLFGEWRDWALVSVGNNFTSHWWINARNGWNEQSIEKRYFCISVFDPADPDKQHPEPYAARRKELYKRAIVIVVDDIVEKVDPIAFDAWPIPSYKMETSPGSEQWGWLLTGEPEPEHRLKHFVHQIIQRYFKGTDPGMAGVTRVVKLPSAFNDKEKKRLPDGSAPKSKLYHFWPFESYTLDELVEVAGFDMSQAKPDRKGRAETCEWPADAPVAKALLDGTIEVADQIDDGRYRVACPNGHNHSDGKDAHKSGMLWLRDDFSIGYHCHHGHCNDGQFTARDFLAAYNLLEDYDSWYARALEGNPPELMTDEEIDEIFDEATKRCPAYDDLISFGLKDGDEEKQVFVIALHMFKAELPLRWIFSLLFDSSEVSEVVLGLPDRDEAAAIDQLWAIIIQAKRYWNKVKDEDRAKVDYTEIFKNIGTPMLPPGVQS